MNKKSALLCATLSLLPMGLIPALATAQERGPADGDREFTIAGTGSSDRNFDSGSVGLSGDYGWYVNDNMLVGIRQSVNYASIEGASLTDDFWNGSTRLFADYHFGDAAMRPFIGLSAGGVYGDGLDNSGFGGVELGLKYYVLEKTFFVARGEYQWFFSDSDGVDDNFDNGAWAYTFGIGYNF